MSRAHLDKVQLVVPTYARVRFQHNLDVVVEQRQDVGVEEALRDGRPGVERSDLLRRVAAGGARDRDLQAPPHPCSHTNGSSRMDVPRPCEHKLAPSTCGVMHVNQRMSGLSEQ